MQHLLPVKDAREEARSLSISACHTVSGRIGTYQRVSGYGVSERCIRVYLDGIGVYHAQMLRSVSVRISLYQSVSHISGWRIINTIYELVSVRISLFTKFTFPGHFFSSRIRPYQAVSGRIRPKKISGVSDLIRIDFLGGLYLTESMYQGKCFCRTNHIAIRSDTH